MKYCLIAIFLLLSLNIPIWGSTDKPLQLSQSNSTKKNKQIISQQIIPHKEKNSKSEANKSKILIVKTAFKQFTLTYSKSKAAIKGNQLNLSLNRKKCNAHILDRFNRETVQIIKDTLKKKEMKITNKKKEIDTIEIQAEGKSYFVKSVSRIGQTFLHLPKEILRMKWEEKFNCTKKKKKSKTLS